jgi:hypothetical protein
MQLVFYRDYLGMSPLCQARLRRYPDIDPTDPADWDDAQHQWGYSGGDALLQACVEKGCDAIRPVPMHGLTLETQIFLLQQYLRHFEHTEIG